MKNAKIIFLILIGVILFCSYGCGGPSGEIDSQGNSELQEDEAVTSLVEKILTPSSDGSPMIFDYAPKPESLDVSAATDSQKLDFVKYISSKDLNSDGEYVTTVHLEEDGEYVIKYSHGGRTLTNSLLGVKIIDPEGNEMILDIAPSEIISEDTIFTLESSDAEIEAWIEQAIAESGMTREELEAELEAYIAESEDYYVPADVAAIPEENPCIVMYMFKAPMTGDYEFALSELLILSEDVEVNQIPDSPFEFRIYSPEAAHSVSDGEEIELTARDIVAIQRILLDFATEFNENGLPVSFESYESYVEEFEVETSDAVLINGRWVMLTRRQIAARRREQERIKAEQERQRAEQERRANYVTVDSVINNVPYDEVFEQGAGFHAHTGLRAVTKIIDDSSFRKNVIQDFSMPTPRTGDFVRLKENFSVNLIATQEEHDRAQELDAISNFALLREALGYTQRQDYARLGSEHTKIISVRYELIEDKPRMPDPKSFRVYDEGIQDIKEEGVNFFLDEYGDYFVAGYTWGYRYDGAVEIVVEPGKSSYRDRQKEEERRKKYPPFMWFLIDVPYYIYDTVSICNKANDCVQDILKNVQKNAVAERDTGKSDDEAKKKIESCFEELNDFQDVTIKVPHSTKTGRAGDISFSLRDFANDLASFIKSAKTTPRSQYGKLYVTLMRFREIEALKSYIPETINTRKSLYNAIRDLNKKIFITRCYYNALMAIPASNLKSGSTIQAQWEKEFQTELVTKMDNGLNYICANEERVNEYYKKFDALYEKYKALAERYNFYRYFVLVCKRSSSDSPSWNDSDSDHNDSWERGFKNYDKSKIVQEDIAAGKTYNHHHSEPSTSGPRGAEFSQNLGDYRVMWLKTGHTNTNHCTGHDINGKTIGRNSYHWKYTGAASRRCEVYLDIKTVRMRPDDYPFAGLE